MILGFVILISILQILIYVFLSWKKIKFPLFIVLLLILIGNTLFFPSYFFPEYEEHETKCGLPTMAIYFFFFFIANGAALLLHILWKIIQKSTIK